LHLGTLLVSLTLTIAPGTLICGSATFCLLCYDRSKNIIKASYPAEKLHRWEDTPGPIADNIWTIQPLRK
jgi:hypothetical protein